MLPLIGSALGSYLAPQLGLSALTASAVGSGLGGLLQTGNLGQGIGAGLGAYATGGMYGNMAQKALPQNFSMLGLGAEQLGQIIGAGAAGQAMAPKPYKRPTLEGVEGYGSRLTTPLTERRRRRSQTGSVKGFQEGGIMSLAGPEMNDKEVVSMAIKALKGELDQETAVQILSDFAAKFGRDALIDLATRVQSGAVDDTAARSQGMIRGGGDGMDDLVPATLEGEEDVLLSDNEYIVPADVVSGLGNGSSDAGARELDRMMDRVRTSRTGTTEQPEPVPAEQMLPV